jgi:putative Mg2+ transporter-C (MgtC) family protein
VKFDTSMFNLTFDENIQIFIRLILAFLAGGLIGYQREKAEKPAGLRTHILVCIGSALITLVSIYGFGKMGSDPSRIVAQIVSGIGFLGAGTIFRFGTSVKGLTTAASLWAICGVGIAIGVGLYFAALLSVLFIMAVLALLELFEQRLRTRGVHLIQVLISDIPGTIGKIGEKLGEMEVNIKNIKMLREGKTFVLVPGSQKEPDKIFIKVGLRNDEFFEILEGLNKDQEIMIPPANIQDSLPNRGPMGMGGPPPAGM